MKMLALLPYLDNDPFLHQHLKHSESKPPRFATCSWFSLQDSFRRSRAYTCESGWSIPVQSRSGSAMRCKFRNHWCRERWIEKSIISLHDADFHKKGRHRGIVQYLGLQCRALCTAFLFHGRICPTHTHLFTICLSNRIIHQAEGVGDHAGYLTEYTSSWNTIPLFKPIKIITLFSANGKHRKRKREK